MKAKVAQERERQGALFKRLRKSYRFVAKDFMDATGAGKSQAYAVMSGRSPLSVAQANALMHWTGDKYLRADIHRHLIDGLPLLAHEMPEATQSRQALFAAADDLGKANELIQKILAHGADGKLSAEERDEEIRIAEASVEASMSVLMAVRQRKVGELDEAVAALVNQTPRHKCKPLVMAQQA